MMKNNLKASNSIISHTRTCKIQYICTFLLLNKKKNVEKIHKHKHSQVHYYVT